MSDRRAFTLVEVVVILVVLSVLAAVAVPLAFRIFQVTAEDATREEMANLKNAMIGNPQKLQSSFRSDFGFLGDIGCMPAVLDRLLSAGALPTPYTFDSTKQAGAGWKGPYITGTPGEDFTTDQWGNNYTYTPAGGPCPLTATLTSNGPDIASTADDITISIGASETTATVQGTVKDTAGVLLEAVPVEFYSSVSGTLTTTGPTNTDANGNYTFNSVPFGPRGVRALPYLVYSPGSVLTSGGGQNILFKVINYSTSPYQITQIRADFGGGSNYDVVRINGSTVDSTNNMVTGTVVNVTPTTIAASPAARPSMRVFVDSPNTQLPDIVISGQGTVATIELNSFNADIRGIPFTVTFNPAGTSSVVKLTPQ